MKTITMDEFKALVRCDDWHHEQTAEIIDSIDIENEEWNNDTEDLDCKQKTQVYGSGSVESRLGDVVISYHEGFNYYQFDRSSFSANPEGLDDVWTLKGVRVVDEDGDPVTDLEWDDLGV